MQFLKLAAKQFLGCFRSFLRRCIGTTFLWGDICPIFVAVIKAEIQASNHLEVCVTYTDSIDSKLSL